MKGTFVTILMFMCALFGVTAQNKMVLSTAEGHPGDEVTISVSLENSDDIVVAELKIPLNDQMKYVEGSCSLNEARGDGHQVTAGMKDGNLCIVLYSFSLKPLKGNSGELLSFKLQLKRTPKTYPLTAEVLVAGAEGNACKSTVSQGAVTILSPEINVETKTVDYGHIPIRDTYTRYATLRNSGNEVLEIAGVEFSATEFSANETVFSIQPGESKSVAMDYAPTVRGAVSEEVIFYSNAINGKQVVTLVADPFSVNELHVGNVSGFSDEEVTVSLTMNNMEPIVGMQCEFALPEQLEYIAGSFKPSERAMGLTANGSVVNGKLKLILYSISGTEIEGNDGEIATFRLRLVGYSGKYTITPQNAVLSNADSENIISDVGGSYVEIKSPKISGASELNLGKFSITEKAKAQYTIKNNGNVPLVINSVAFLGEGYNIVDELPIIIGNSSSVKLNVEYTPTAEGRFSAVMNIYSNDPVNKMLSVNVKGEVYEPNHLTFDGENLQNGDYVVSFGLENYTDVVALQMDIHWMPGMLTSIDMLKVSERLKEHTCNIKKIDDDTYRFIAFSLSNKEIVGNSGKLFDLTFTPDNGVDYKNTSIVIDNVIMSSSDADNRTTQLMLNAKAEYKNYYVRFVSEGEIISESFQRVGTPIVQPTMPEKTGYTFAGWEIDKQEEQMEIPIDLASNADNMLYSNAYCTNTSYGDQFKGWHVLFDGRSDTFFHSEYSNKESSDGLDHYWRVDLGVGNEIDEFSFTYTTRNSNSNINSPTRIVVEGSNVADDNYDEIAVLTGLPTTNSTVYNSDILGNGNKYRYIRFRVTRTAKNQSVYGHPFFFISEFGMTKHVKLVEVPDVMPEKDLTLNALFTLNSYTITYLVDGEEYATVMVEYGSKIELPEDECVCWDMETVPETMPAKDIVITGTRVPTVIGGVDAEIKEAVIYNLNGLRVLDTDNLERGVYIINGKKVWLE